MLFVALQKINKLWKGNQLVGRIEGKAMKE